MLYIPKVALLVVSNPHKTIDTHSNTKICLGGGSPTFLTDNEYSNEERGS